MRLKLYLLLLQWTLITLSGNSFAGNSALLDILKDKHRSAPHQSRDRFRHPSETLDFFAVHPDMTVVEIWPGGKGWYTEILAPYLKQYGHLYAAHFDENSTISYFSVSLQEYRLKLAANPDLYAKVTTTTLQAPSQLKIAPDNSADRVLTFRNVHNWMKYSQAETVFKAMYQALKPGGILGIVEHRNSTKTQQDPRALSGYVTEAYVIHLATQAGFELLAKSEINANPKDTHEHPNGVWSLPPTLRGGEKNKDYFQTIGESDRMTLKFIKH